MRGNHLVCEQAVFDGGVNDPRTRIYLYQQRLRAELFEKLDMTVHRPWWSAPPMVVAGPIRSIMALRRSRYARNDAGASPEYRVPWVHHRPSGRPGLVALQGRALGAIAEGRVSAGTLHEIAAHLDTGVSVLREALRALLQGGWIAAQLLPAERMVVRLERRHASADAPSSPNRRVHIDAWAL